MHNLEVFEKKSIYYSITAFSNENYMLTREIEISCEESKHIVEFLYERIPFIIKKYHDDVTPLYAK